MRFAWLRKNTPDQTASSPSGPPVLTLIRIAYNLVFWVFLLPFVTTIDYGVGFLAFAVVIFVRLAANLYANNVIKFQPAQYERYPFRS